MESKPNFDEAIVDDSKLLDYLLARTHPVGREKARYFRSIGFKRQFPDGLRRALLFHARENRVVALQQTRFGAKYVIEGPLEAPSGSYLVRTVWFVARHEAAPRLVTAYPLGGDVK